ncbi:MAG: amidohydrolase family protein, partial [Acidimicrobiia bacterium]
EPADVWTSRMSKAKWGDLIPHVVFDERRGEERWMVGDETMMPGGMPSITGWPEPFPSYPPTLADCHPATHEPRARLALLDSAGIQSQVIFPNLVGFFAQTFLKLDREFSNAAIRAYNDFMTEFCSTDPARLVHLTVLPFWDVEESVAEMERGMAAGHKGVLFAHTFEQLGLPNIPDPHWAPILDAAQSLGQSINFHIGFGSKITAEAEEVLLNAAHIPRVATAEASSLSFVSNARALTLIILHGVCHRYPRLKFVTVESGFGFIPMLLEKMDWQFHNNGMVIDHPDWLLPSEYFKRQVYANVWHERVVPDHIEEFQDNLMWETDFPHPTSNWPTPHSLATPPQESIARMFAGASPEALRKILHDNAADLYHLD